MIHNTNKRHQFENCKRKMLFKIKRNAEQFLMYINLTKKQISNQVEDIVLILSNAAIYNLLSMVWTKQ